MSKYTRDLALWVVIPPLLITLAGCGFQWCGASHPHPNNHRLHPPIKTLQLQSTYPNHYLTRTLRNRLIAAGIHISQQGSILRLLKEKRTQYTQTLAHNVESRIYTFVYTVEFQWIPQKPLAATSAATDTSPPIQTRSTQRRVIIRQNEALGSTDQVDLITQEMQDDLVGQLVGEIVN